MTLTHNIARDEASTANESSTSVGSKHLAGLSVLILIVLQDFALTLALVLALQLGLLRLFIATGRNALFSIKLGVTVLLLLPLLRLIIVADEREALSTSSSPDSE